MASESIDQRVDVLRETIVALVRRDGPDLSARQLGVFLTCYRADEAQTVRGLAAKLAHRRSVLVQRTLAGNGFMRDLTTILANAGKDVGKMAGRGRRIRETV